MGRLVFIDETWAKTNMAPLRGWCRRGARLKAKAPFGRWKTMTFIAALRHDRIDAPFLIEGSANMEVFAAYVGKVLCPELEPGDQVILDNLCIHKTPTILRLVEARGATVRYLPAYSPDMNPIELAFSKLKSHLRQAAARTLDELQGAVARSLSQFQPDHCRGFLRHAQYGTI